MKFINREKELTALSNFWKEKKPQLIIIYGKRRVGKTELIKQFINKKTAIYFLARKISEHDNLKSLGETVGRFFKDTLLIEKGFDSWEQFFIYLKEKIHPPTIIVIDEFPYLAEGTKGLSSIFQWGWDEHLKNIPIYLILCGSSISMMESETLAYRAPLYGRRTGQLFLKPMSFFDIRKFLPKKNFETCLAYYSICGGNPAYTLKLLNYPNLTQAISEEILTPEKFLYEEVEFILKVELREPRNYFSILRAISLGKSKSGEIINDTRIEKSALHNYLFTLEDLHLIQKRVPVTEKNPLKSRKGQYFLQDQFFIFWFNYVYPYLSELELGNKELSLKKFKETFIHLMSSNYEKVCADLLLRTRIPFPIQKIGHFWDKNIEIDLIAFNEDENSILFGEAKWSTKPVGTNIFIDLKNKATNIDWGKKERREHFALFSKSGFTEAMLKTAKRENVLLFKQDKLI